MSSIGQVYTTFNYAGGVGKTSLTRDLGYALSQRGYRVLLIDGDPQGSLSEWLGVAEIKPEQTLLNLVRNEAFPEPVHVHGMWLVPANESLMEIEREIDQIPGGQMMLRHELEPERDNYDFVLIDSPPSLSSLTFLCGLAGDGFIVPVETSLKGLRGLVNVKKYARRFAKALRLRSDAIRMIVPDQYDERTAVDRRVNESLDTLASKYTVAPKLAYRPGAHRRAVESRVPVGMVPGNRRAKHEIDRVADVFLEKVAGVAEVAHE